MMDSHGRTIPVVVVGETGKGKSCYKKSGGDGGGPDGSPDGSRGSGNRTPWGELQRNSLRLGDGLHKKVRE